MKHDLKAINAALRLGDSPLPPIGAVIRCFGPPPVEYTIISVCRITLSYTKTITEITLHKHDAHNPTTTAFIRKFMQTAKDALFYECVKIPEGAPPFEEWKRY